MAAACPEVGSAFLPKTSSTELIGSWLAGPDWALIGLQLPEVVVVGK